MARNIDLDGIGVLYNNAVANIREVMRLYLRDEVGIRPNRYYDEDVANPESNSIAIDIVGHSSEIRSWVGMQKRNLLTEITVNVWYYHEQLNSNTRSVEVKNIIGRISQMFMKHNSVNGFCSPLGCTVIGSEYFQRRLDNKIMTGGLVRLMLRKYHTINNLD